VCYYRKEKPEQIISFKEVLLPKIMEKKGKTALILAAITALAGGGLALSFDFSQTTTTTTETNISGDTIFEGDDTTIQLSDEDIEEMIEVGRNLNCQLDIFEDPDCED